ncbi:GGDEF domain-containing protein [Paenibacillus sinopodophylli]|uniref:GGDEF domain-containing protein n=1 Tax=Paenibacillus sinopodophylli TaxID=1837342 RepID=UPI00110CABB2|nr:GGDEF domain-containing protein [Paenibacillus sinopodophylli]
MHLSFKAKLMTIMGIFSILLTLSVSLVNQHRLKTNLIASYAKESALVEDTVVAAVSAADKAFQLSDKDIEDEMRDHSDKLLQKYSEQPDVAKWDYQALKAGMGDMDIYMIDRSLTIRFSSFPPDVGLNFHDDNGTLSSFSELLTTRLNGNQFTTDGIDQETNTGMLRKYSYIPTPDHKYLIELGLYLNDNPVFQSFNFLEISNTLIEKYSYINDITVFTTTGKSIGKKGEDGKSLLISNQNVPAFNLALKESAVRVIKGVKDGDPVTYRYVPYSIRMDDQPNRFTDQRMIEIVYNDSELASKLQQNNQIFLLQLLATIVIALMISYIITKLVARPMYLASHDLLTGLSNRASFENALDSTIARSKKKQHKAALLHIDLDNFKRVNDTLGHDAGDSFLIEVGKRIRMAVIDSNHVAARLGGDEFVVILNHVEDTQDALDVANHIIDEMKRPIEIKGINVTNDLSTTVSIGIAISPEHAEDSEELYACADKALYHAKRSGKNTYSVYDETLMQEVASN